MLAVTGGQVALLSGSIGAAIPVAMSNAETLLFSERSETVGLKRVVLVVVRLGESLCVDSVVK